MSHTPKPTNDLKVLTASTLIPPTPIDDIIQEGNKTRHIRGEVTEIPDAHGHRNIIVAAKVDNGREQIVQFNPGTGKVVGPSGKERDFQGNEKALFAAGVTSLEGKKLHEPHKAVVGIPVGHAKQRGAFSWLPF